MPDLRGMVSCAAHNSVRDQLIEQNLDLAKTLAWRLWKRLPGCVDIEDLEADAYLGLLKAAGNFDPARGVKFRTYASPRIRGQMLDGLRQRNHGKRNAPPVRVESLDVEVHGGDGRSISLVETIADDSEPVGTAMEMLDEAEVVLKNLKPESRQLLIDRYLHGKTQQKIADEMGISGSAVSLRFKRIRKHIAQMRNRS